MDSIFDPASLKQELDKIPTNTASVAVKDEDGDIGAEGTISKQIGKDGFVEAEGSWMKKAGYKVAAMFGWKW